MSSLLPRPDECLGPYPERAEEHTRGYPWPGTGPRLLRARLRHFVTAVGHWGPEMAESTEQALQQRAGELRLRLTARDLGDPTLAQVFALIRELSARRLGLRHYDAQIAAGWVMLRGKVAEMETGEGKTLAATLSAGTAALAGLAVHVVTVNSYLARRDAELMAPLYQALGLTVDAAAEGMDADRRRTAYRADITYCTHKQLVFDYLRDRLAMGDRAGSLELQLDRFDPRPCAGLFLRGLQFAIVDEADSILIDEARTPLIIAATHEEPEQEEIYRQALELAGRLEERHDYTVAGKQGAIELSAAGRARLARWARGGIWNGRRRREFLVTQALTALHLFRRDHHYLVTDGRINIVDEYTGRLRPDSAWEHGLQQMIECKEGCPLTGQSETLGRISFQRFFSPLSAAGRHDRYRPRSQQGTGFRL